MLFLLFAVIIGIGFSIFAVQNTVNVPVQLGTLSLGTVPLYVVVIVSLLLGITVASVLRLFDWATTGLTLRGKDRQLHRSEEHVHSLEQRIHELEEENNRLREHRNEKKIVHTNSDIDKNDEPSLSSRLRQSFSH